MEQIIYSGVISVNWGLSGNKQTITSVKGEIINHNKLIPKEQTLKTLI